LAWDFCSIEPGENVMTKIVDVKEAKLPELVLLALEGNEVIITERDKPVARLISIASSTKPRVAGLHPNSIWVSEDFDEPLPDEFWLGEE
jgi:antitoxin (DNA-binding transcriptional repressor) of toxin-antitoxin stability system